MRRIKTAIYKFMYGRYGSDSLNKALLWCYAGLILAYMIIFLFVEEKKYASRVPSSILSPYGIVDIRFHRDFSFFG